MTMALRDFIELLRREGELAEITAEVDPYLEMSEIADRAVKARGPALLFAHPKGHSLAVLMNQFGTARRMELALGAPLDDIAARIGGLLDLQMPQGLVGKVKALGQLRELASFAPRVVKNGSFREVVVEPPDLGRLPVLTSWPGDGGPFITLPIVVTNDRSGRRNAGMYRLQVFDAQSTGMHWHVHHDGAANFRESDGRLEVAVALGTDPAVTYAATAPLPPGVDEMMFAGFLRGEPVELARCATVDLQVPADAEIVLEGYVQRGEERDEGPFGDHTGYYSLVDRYPVFHLTAMSHRKDAVYPATLVGRPPMEDCYLGKATERLFLPLLRLTLPEIVDLELPVEGVFHDCAIVSIRKAYPGHARKVMSAIWGMGQMMFTKFVVVVDEHVDVHDASEVTWRVFNNVDPERDCVITKGPLDVLDHSSPTPRYGAKMGIDATRTWAEEGHPREWPDELAMTPAVVARVTARWAEFGLPFA
jgi:4-hydroxy-3-polyprenylbenzoate decarboxylase